MASSGCCSAPDMVIGATGSTAAARFEPPPAAVVVEVAVVATVTVVVVVVGSLVCVATTRAPSVGLVVAGDDGGTVGGVTVLGPAAGSVLVVVVVGGSAVDPPWWRFAAWSGARCSAAGGVRSDPRWPQRPRREGRPTRRRRPTSAAGSVPSAARAPLHSWNHPPPRRDLRCRIGRGGIPQSRAEPAPAPIAAGVERSAVPSGEECQLSDGETEDMMGVEHFDVFGSHPFSAKVDEGARQDFEVGFRIRAPWVRTRLRSSAPVVAGGPGRGRAGGACGTGWPRGDRARRTVGPAPPSRSPPSTSSRGSR